MKAFFRFIAIVICMYTSLPALYAQEKEEWSSALDSARALEDNKKDSVVFSARYIRFTTLERMKKGTYTEQIDTLHKNLQYYNPQNQPWNPSINLGSYGLATRDLLFNPDKNIGFQMGFHAMDRYVYQPDSVKYFRARSPFSELYMVGFFFNDQVFRGRISQNINPRWNIGGEFHATSTDGYYTNQKYSELKSTLFSWYESSNRRYNMLVNVMFNKLDATENGSVVSDTLFHDGISQSSDRYGVQLNGTGANRPRNVWRDNSVFLRQSYYMGRLDTVDAGKPEMQVFPTNSIAHNTYIRWKEYTFKKNESDSYGTFPYGGQDLMQDTTKLTNISNEFTYDFYFRGKSLFKNEAKLSLGFQNDLYWYTDRGISNRFYQNNMVKGDLGYQFSDKVHFNAKVKQIVAGENSGDFLYEALADFQLSKDLGKIYLSAYSQNKSPERVFERLNYSYHQWERSFEKTKTQNLTFKYANPKLGFSAKAEYFLIDNYLLFKEVPHDPSNTQLNRVIEPVQIGAVNLLKLSVGQKVKFGRFTFDNILVFQKSDNMDELAIPAWYSWHSLYYSNVLSKVLDFNLGVDMKMNTPFRTPSYSINSGQFYNDNVGIEFSTYPIVDLWATATLRRANIFIAYNFINQLVAPAGYYTVRRYPMNNANIRFGLSWKFYD